MRKLFKQNNFLKRLLLKWAVPLGFGFLLYLLLKFVFVIGFVPSVSMEPTIKSGSFIVGIRVYNELRLNDIIIFSRFGNLTVKRISGLPGDTVKTNNGELLTVPSGSYFVTGDSPYVSFDSRHWAAPFISRDAVVAKFLHKD